MPDHRRVEGGEGEGWEGEKRGATRHTHSTATYLSAASSTRAQRRKRLNRAAAFVEDREVVPVVPARMEKTAVLALGHLARAPRGTARIYFTGCARRGLARCPQPLATVLVADLAALHSLACTSNTGRDCDFLTDPPFFFPPRLTGAFPILGRPCPPTDPRFFFPPLTGVTRSPVPSPYSAVLSRLGTNSTLRAKTTPAQAPRTDALPDAGAGGWHDRATTIR